jgi:NADPH:quinone reductase-like Zn-dependent oxidoreductase
MRGLRVLAPQAAPDPALLDQVAELVASGQVAPVMDRRFALAQAADAIRYMETEHTRGKVVVTMA